MDEQGDQHGAVPQEAVAGGDEPFAEPAAPDHDASADHGEVTAEVGTAHDDAAVHEPDAGLPTEVWLVVALLVLFAIAYRTAKKAIVGALDARSARIKTELDEAQRLREEAQSALAGFQRRQRDAMTEAEAIIAHAREDAERVRQQALADLEQLLKRREKLAMDRIAQAEANAAAEVRNIAVDVAIAASRQLIADSLDQKKAQALIDEAIADLPKRLH